MPHASAAQFGFDPYRDTGNILGDAWRGAKKGVKSIGKQLRRVPGTSAITSQFQFVSDVASGKNVLKSARRAGTDIYRDAKRSMPIARTVLSFVPGVGTGVSAALAAADAALNGKSIAEILKEAAIGAIPGGPIANAAVQAMAKGLSGASVASIAEAAARGAAPEYISAAVDVASDVARGKNVAKSLLSNAAKSFVKGSQAEAGFNIASAVLTGQNPSAAMLAATRKQLGSEEARRAFDSAVGTVSRGAGSSAFANVQRFAARVVPKVTPGPGRIAARFVPVNRTMATLLARRVPSISLSALQGRRDTSGLDASGTTYTVENGDYAYKIAQKLTGNGNNWRQLVSANPQKKTNPKDGNFATLYAGEVLKLPATWSQKAAPKLTADVLSQARAILKTWSDSDGLSQAGVTDYGDRPEDAALTWGPRDKLMMMAFVSWWRDKFGADLPLVSDLNDRNADALRAWLARHANTLAPPSPTRTTSPSASDDAAPTSPGLPPIASAAASAPIGGSTATNAQNPLSGTTAIPADVLALMASAQQIDTEAGLMAVVNQLRAKGYQAEADKLLAGFKAKVAANTVYNVPADVAAMAAAAQASGSVDTMRKTANAIYGRYSPNVPTSVQSLVDTLNASADKLEAAQMGVPTQVIPMTVTGTAPAKKKDDAGLLIVLAAVVAKVGGFI